MLRAFKGDISALLKKWLSCDDGMAAMEASMIFPIMLVLLLGTYDLGFGILANQKTIRASQVTSDLVTRTRTLSVAELDEAITAGQLALQPFNTAEYGVDVVSVSFDENSVPTIVDRETRNMTPVSTVLTDVAAIAEPNGGVVMVTVRYLFEPAFAGFVIDDIQMQEVAFARGRKSAVVRFE